MWRMGTAVFRMWSLYSTSYYYLKNIYIYIILSSKKFYLKVAQWQVKERNSKFWFCGSFWATHCSQVEVHVTDVKREKESITRCVSAERGHGQSNSSGQCLCCQFSYLDQRFSPFLSWSCAHLPPIPNQSTTAVKQKRNRKEKVNMAHFQAVEAIWLSLNSLGLLLDHFNTGQFHTQVFRVV